MLYNLYAHEGPRNRMLEGIAPGASGIELVLPELGQLHRFYLYLALGTGRLVRATRDQIGRGADWVKVYADYREMIERERPDGTVIVMKSLDKAWPGKPTPRFADPSQEGNRRGMSPWGPLLGGDGRGG